MRSARAFYEASKGKGAMAHLAKGLVYVHQNVRLSMGHLWNQQARIFADYLSPGDGERGVLMLGSSVPPDSMPEFAGHRVVQIDLKKHAHVDVVADAEKLTETFPPGSFDFVVSTSMLEHTPHPVRVVEQVFAVLRPGGVFYLSVPWMFPLHGEPHDYWRFSLPCLHQMTGEAGFLVRESGSECSPHGAAHFVMKTYLSEVFSQGDSVAFYALEYAFDWLLTPFKLMERVARLGKRANYYTDSIVYVVAQKPSLPRS